MPLKEKIRALDEQYDDLPRKIFLVCCVFLVSFAIFGLLKYLWPFLLGFLFALIMNPIVKLISGAFSKLRCGKKIALGLSMLLVYGIIGFLFSLLFKQIYSELEKLIKALPDILDYIENIMHEWGQMANPANKNGIQEKLNLLINQANDSILEYVRNFIGKATPTVANSTINIVKALPKAILFVVMTIMSSYYFVSDKEKISRYFEKLLPHGVVHRANALSDSVWYAVGQQIRAQIFVSFCVMIMLIIGFYIFGVDYALVAGIAIGVIDVLPIVGAGTVLIPWGIFNLFAGNIALGLKLEGLYIAVVALRQVIEPRVVGHKLGLYPLITMLSMYVGMKLMGFLGLIVGPVLANICKVVLESDAEIRRQQRAKTQKKSKNAEHPANADNKPETAQETAK
jgi:sporulation integral membrane protein YtvI